MEIKTKRASQIPPFPPDRHSGQRMSTPVPHQYNHNNIPQVSPTMPTTLMSPTASSSATASAPGSMRSRITVVCAECKRLKLKCDRRTPCGSCQKRDTVSRCIYSPAAAEKVDLHSLNNRLIQVETTLTQMTSGSSAPFVSSYPPASGGAGQALSSADTAKANQPTQPTPGPSNFNKQSSVCHSNIPTSQAPIYHAIFKGDRSALTIPLPVITNTFLSGAFQLHSPSELEQEELSTLQALGVDLTASSHKGKASTKTNYQTTESFETTGMNAHKGTESVKLEPTFVSLQHHSGTHPDPVSLPLNTPNGPTTTGNNPSAHPFPAPASHPYNSQPYNSAPEAGGFRVSMDANAEQERSLLDRNGLPPLSAYLIPSRPSYEHVFSSSAQTPAPDQSWGPASRHGVTSAVLSYLPHDWDEIKQLVANVEHFERNTGVCEDRSYLEQRIRSMVDGTTSPDGQSLSLSFFASACALLALGSELRRQSTLDHHHDESRMIVDSNMSDPGKGNGGLDPRQWRNNPNFIAHRSFGTSAHTISSALVPPPYTSPPTFNAYPPTPNRADRAIADPTLLYDLSVQALSLADSESQIQPADIDYVQACLWQVKYLFASDRLMSLPRKEGTGTLALPLVGKMVNVARQIDLGSDPDDDDDDDPDLPGRSSSRPQMVDNDEELEIEKNRRRRVWWEVVYYDLFISDSMNHPPLIAPAHIPMPPSSNYPPTPLREYLNNRQLDPTSLLYDTSAPYTTLLPNYPNDFADIMSEFELRCRLAQLVKLIQARLSSGRGYSFEQLASYETDLRTTLEAFREDWSGGGGGEEDTANNVNADGPSRSGVRPTDLSKAEATLIINKLIIKLYLPFVRPKVQPTGDAHERSSARPVLHQAIYGLVNAAHGLLTAAQTMVSLAPSKPFLPPHIVLDFYDFGRFVFDATVVCAYAHSTQPTAMWAPQAKEDVATGASLIDSESMKEMWHSVDGMHARTDRPTSLNWIEVHLILRALRKNCCAPHGSSLSSASIIVSPAACGSKRKLVETQANPEERVQEEVEREERNARYEHRLSNDRTMPVASNPYPLDVVPNTHGYDTPPLANPPPQDPFPSVGGKRRVPASTFIASTITPNIGAQKTKPTIKKPRTIVRHRMQLPDPVLPLGVRWKKDRSVFSPHDIDGEGSPHGAPDPPPPEEDEYEQIDSYRSRSSSLMQDGIQHPSPQHRLDSPSTGPLQEASARTRRPSDHDTPVVSDIPMLYGASPTSYDSPYDTSRGSVDAEVYAPSSSPYGNTTSSSGPLSAASSPYTQTSGQSHNAFNSSPNQRSPAFEPSRNPSTETATYYVAPNPDNNAPYESQYDSSHMRHGGAPMEYSAPHPGHYGMKVGSDGPPPPPPLQMHPMSVQASQHRSYGQQQVMPNPQTSQWSVNSIPDMGISQQPSSHYGWQEHNYY